MVAMSGGVDSSVAAAMLREQGYDVIGIAMRLAPDAPASLSSGKARRGTCCSHEDFEDARRVAERLDFPFYVADLREEFGNRVIGNFVTEYLHGRTPNPCVMCNREIKFDRLWQRARALGVETIATGHYARIEHDREGSYRLLRAIYPVFRVLFPNQVIPSDDLARAMVDVVVRETGQRGGPVFENRDIRAMVESLNSPSGTRNR